VHHAQNEEPKEETCNHRKITQGFSGNAPQKTPKGKPVREREIFLFLELTEK
jgi:hypothetical protein